MQDSEETVQAPTNLPSSIEGIEPEQNDISFSSLTPLQNAVLNVVCASESLLTIREIAGRLGRHTGAISRAMRDEKYVLAYQKICLACSHIRLKDVLETNANMAAAGSPQHAKMFLQMHNLLHDKIQDTPPPKDDDNSYEKLQKRKIELEEQLNQKYNTQDAEFTEVQDAEQAKD